MGMDPGTLAIIGSTVLDAGSNLFGAHNQNQTNNANLNAQIAQQQMMQQYVNQFLQPGANPYSQAISNFIGRGSQIGGQQPYIPQVNGQPVNLPNGPITKGRQVLAGLGGAGGAGANGLMSSASMLSRMPTVGAGGMPQARTGPTYNDWISSNDQDFPNREAAQNAYGDYMLQNGLQAPGGMAGMDAAPPGAGAGGNMAGLTGQAWIDAQDPAWINAIKNSPIPEIRAMLTDPDWVASMGYGIASDGSLMDPNTGAVIKGPNAGLAGKAGYINTGPGGAYTPPAQGPASYLQGGQMFDNAGQAQGAFNWLQNNPGQAFAPQMDGGQYTQDALAQLTQGVPNFSQGGEGGAFGGPNDAQLGGQMYTYHSPGAFTYNPAQLGAAPQVGAQQIAGSPQVNAQQISGLPQLTAPTGTQGFNAGQDGLMQLMNKQLQPSQDPSLSLNLQSLNNTGDPFNNSDLFKALQPLDQQGIDRQVSDLHGSAGSLGQRFGTAMNRNEGTLRTDIQNNLNARNAQIQQQSYEQAQARRMQSLGMTAGIDQSNNQFALANAGLNLNAAQGLAQTGLQGGALDLQAGQSNLQAMLQAALANQSTNLNAQQFNAQQGFNVGQANQQANLQAGMANQNTLAQYGINNMNALNQAGQFNAGQRTQADQFAASQGQAYNQLILQALGNAGNLQQGQNSYNAGLLGILNGVGVPQAQPSAIPGAISDASSSAMMLPFLLQMMGRQGGGGSPYTPSQFQMPSFAPGAWHL